MIDMKDLFAIAYFFCINKTALRYYPRLTDHNRSTRGFCSFGHSTSEKHVCNNSKDSSALIVTAIRAGQACSLISAGPDSGGWKKDCLITKGL